MEATRIHFPFHDGKAREATAELLRLAGGTLDRFHLVKCVYLADKASLARRERPICGGRYVNMRHGPVPKDLYARVTGYVPGWGDCVEVGEEHDIHLIGECAPRLLSVADLAILRETYSTYGQMPFPILWRLVHDPRETPEYVAPPPSQVEVPLLVESILAGIGRTPEDIERVRRESAAEAELDALLPEAPLQAAGKVCLQRDTFLMTDGSGGKHLALVMSDPLLYDGKVIVTNFSTWAAHKDQTCIVPAGSHSFLSCRSVVMYGRTRLVVAEYIDSQVASGRFDAKPQANPALFALVCAGFLRTRDVSVALLNILRDQGVI